MSADKFARFSSYVRKMDTATQGAGGRGQAFKFCSKAYEFKLHEDEAWDKLLEWDKACSPSWASTNELGDLRGILSWVYRNPSKPFGHMIESHDRAALPRLASMPARKSAVLPPPVELPAPVALPTEVILPSRAILAAFEQGELIRVQLQVASKKEGAWMPKGFGEFMTREQVVAALDADALRGNKDAGIYMGQNPIRPGLDEQTAAKDEGVATFRHALVEFDSASLEQQFAVILATRLPVSAVVYSGGKSLHAWVCVDAPDLETYRQRVGVIHSLPLLAAAGMDKANKNPSRLTRLPGARRGDKVQFVVAIGVGAASWDEWTRMHEQATPADEPKAEDEERGRPFEVMGYDDCGNVVFWLNDLLQKYEVKLGHLGKMENLLAIAKVSFWKDKFGKGDDLKWSAVEAAEWLRGEAVRAGCIGGGNLADKIRGRGIWQDGGQFVANLGNRREVDGRPMDGAWRSPEGFVYQSGVALEMAQEAATDEEAQAYVQLIQSQSGSKDGGLALAGLVANAFLLGCVDPRPSAWIDGQKGAGKTQTARRVLRALGRWVVKAESPTEASIRHELKADALMIVCDESESDSDLGKSRTTMVVELVRKSFDGDGARTSRGTPGGKGALVWQTRTCGFFSSINDGLNLDRDTSRFVQVRLPKGRTKEDYKRQLPIEARCLGRPGFMPRLARRAYDYAPAHSLNQDKLAEVLARQLDDPRTVDKFASLLAGATMLTHGRLISDDEAAAIVEGFDLSAFSPSQSVEQDKLLERLLSSQLDAGSGDKPTVRELIARKDEGAGLLLGRAGLFMHKEKGLCVAYGAQGLLNLLPDAPWNKDSKRVKSALLAATSKDKTEKVRFNSTTTHNAVAIPHEVLTSYGLDPF